MIKNIIYSVIIPTYNRKDELELLIPSLARQDFDPEKFEILVVDDGSKDDTEVFMEAMTSLYIDHNIRYIKQENQGPGTARNNGMENAFGEYYIFVDSDTIIPPQWLKSIDDFLSENQCDAFGGPDKAKDDFSPFLKAVDYAMTSFIGTGGMRGSKGKKLANYYPRSFNMGLRKEVFGKIGGFNQWRHGQDLDFSYRIEKAGFKTLYIPDAYLYHKRRTSIWRYFKQVYNWGVTRVNLWKTHGKLELLHILPSAAALTYIFTGFLGIFFKYFLFIWLGINALALFLFLVIFIESYMKYRSIKISFLSILTIVIQKSAYGLGFISGMFKHLISKDKKAEIKGITKNYYK